MDIIYESISRYSVQEFDQGYKDEHGVVYSQDGKKLLDCTEDIESYTVREGTEIICDSAFYRMYSLKNITIPDSVFIIGRDAFQGCLLLSHVELSNNLLMIAASAFKDCKSLQFVQLPNSIQILGFGVFYGCIMLNQASIPYNVKCISSHLFYGCHSLKRCICSTSLCFIGERAFHECVNLEIFDCSINEQKDLIHKTSKYEFNKYNVESGNGVEKYAFETCVSLKKVKLSDEIKFIGKCAFTHCISLEELSFGRNVNFVHEIAFEKCKGLKKFHIPDDGLQTYEALKEFMSYVRIDFNPLKSSQDLRVETFRLGEKFPWPEYSYTGKHVTTVINNLSFDLVISMCGLKFKEKRAVAAELPVISIFIYKSIPFFIINFGDVVISQVSINVLKMKEEILERWFDSDYDVIRCFLLEGHNGTLQAYTTITFPYMKELKRLLKIQLSLDSQQIDHIIDEAVSKYTIYEMQISATYTVAIGVNG
jgi:hypothetical protein